MALRPWQHGLLLQTVAVLVLTCHFIIDSTNAHKILLVQFDGSLRPAQDVGFPLCRGRMGTVAAACAVIDKREDITMTRSKRDGDEDEDEDDDIFRRLIVPSSHQCQSTTSSPWWWLGGRALSPGSINNSGEAEYEGLLLGLGKAVQLINNHHQQKDNSPIHKILIQGDCKTVIDQMKDSARPRKLRSHFLRAQDILKQLTTRTTTTVDIIYEHIPREQNKLCDALCGVIRSEILEPSNWHVVTTKIENINRNDCSMSSIFNAMDPIPYSQRPSLYHQLAQKALEQDDYQGLIQVGEVMECDAKMIWSSSSAAAASASASAAPRSTMMMARDKQLQAQGVRYQIQGLQGMSTKKSLKLAAAKERKNRFLFRQHQQQEEQQHSRSSPQEDATVMEPTATTSLVDWTTTSTISESHHDNEKASTSTNNPQSTNHDDDDDEQQPILLQWLDKARTSKQWQQEQCQWLEVAVPRTNPNQSSSFGS